ncbi:MAG: hypothetical protein ABL894_07235 [Hyphomicrobium sp.]
MPVNWWFNAEVRRGEGWEIPAELPPKNLKYGCPIGGEFGWIRQNWQASTLFFGARALFSFNRGRPPGDSEFCRLWDAYQPGWDIAMEAHWIGFERLNIGLWDEPAVLVHALVPVRFAGLFGDGTCALPEAALLAAGASGEDFSRLRNGATPASRAIGNVANWDRAVMATTPRQDGVAVSWLASVNGLLPGCAERFHELARLAKPEDLRVIALRS